MVAGSRRPDRILRKSLNINTLNDYRWSNLTTCNYLMRYISALYESRLELDRTLCHRRVVHTAVE